MRKRKGKEENLKTMNVTKKRNIREERKKEKCFSANRLCVRVIDCLAESRCCT